MVCLATLSMAKPLMLAIFVWLLLAVFQLNGLLSTAGWLLIYSSITWNVVKYFRFHFDKQLIPPAGKAVLITGCDHGFGHSLAKQLNARGFRVFAACLNPSTELKNQCQFPDKMAIIGLDVTDLDNVQHVGQEVEKALNETGDQLWAVVNNAGIFITGEVEWGKIDTIKRVFDVNVLGLVQVTRQFLPLIRRSRGRVVNMASISGHVTGPGLSTYSMTKHAVVSFSDALRREMMSWGVKVITIEPGVYKTPMAGEKALSAAADRMWADTEPSVRDDFGANYFHAFKERIVKGSARGRNPNEVVEAIVDGIVSEKPLTRYRCCGYGTRIVWWAAEHLPSELIDSFIYYSRGLTILPKKLDKYH